MMLIDVAIPVPLHHPFTYEVPEALRARVQPGMRVLVPFHRRQIVGIVIAEAPDPQLETRGLKTIIACLDDHPILHRNLLTLLEWISTYYAAPIGEVCRAALPRPFFRQRTFPSRSHLPQPHLTHMGFKRDGPPIQLTTAQIAANQTIMAAIDQHTFTTFLLHGITGSGKTEVYLQIIAHTLAQNRQAILLVPEIGLTPQLLSRVATRFGEAVAIYHSGLTEAQRVAQWQRMFSGEARICVGTRSALFAPFADCGCIIIDEEHDTSYKQEESPRYHARDAAVMHAREAQAVVVLGSATPSLESFHNVREKKYRQLLLPARATGVALPAVEIVDMRAPRTDAKTSTIFSNRLFAAIETALADREQVLLFFNRRGFAPAMLCRHCGDIARCPNCDIPLTVHHDAAQLRCHYCEYAIPVPSGCRQCDGDGLRPVGAGTERLEQMLRTRFPAARIARFDRDTGSRRVGRESILQRMHGREIDILVGTQMIAKGHDFPNVGLVGVVAADQSLYLPDFRAGERTFQLLTQVAGRAGRGAKQGRVIIQTFTPDHYALRHASATDYEAFFAEESRHREALRYPPFGRLVNVRISGNKEGVVRDYAYALAAVLRTQTEHVSPVASHRSPEESNGMPATGHGPLATTVLGPAPAALKKIGGKYRWQLLVKAQRSRSIAEATRTIHTHTAANAPRGVHVACDVDPVNLL